MIRACGGAPRVLMTQPGLGAHHNPIPADPITGEWMPRRRPGTARTILLALRAAWNSVSGTAVKSHLCPFRWSPEG